MSAEELYAAYCAWEPGLYKLSESEFFRNTLEAGDVTVRRTETEEVNRLYWILPSFAEGKVHCFVFFEETVVKLLNEGGDCEVLGTCYRLESTS